MIHKFSTLSILWLMSCAALAPETNRCDPGYREIDLDLDVDFLSKPTPIAGSVAENGVEAFQGKLVVVEDFAIYTLTTKSDQGTHLYTLWLYIDNAELIEVEYRRDLAVSEFLEVLYDPNEDGYYTVISGDGIENVRMLIITILDTENKEDKMNIRNIEMIACVKEEPKTTSTTSETTTTEATTTSTETETTTTEAITTKPVTTTSEVTTTKPVTTNPATTTTEPECPDVSSPTNGEAIQTGVTMGSTTTITCSEGYYLNGYHSITCLPNGEWNYNPAACKECPERTKSINAARDFLVRTKPFKKGRKKPLSDITLNIDQVVTYTITPSNSKMMNFYGFEVNAAGVQSVEYEIKVAGQDSIKSTVFQTASDSELGLFDITTQDFSNVEYIKLKFTGVSQDAKINYIAIKGCLIIQCQDVDSPTNGLAIKSELTVGSSITFQCSSGYQLVGPETILCKPTGEWDQNAPVCEIIRCPDVDSPSNGQAIKGDLTVGSTVKFTCSSGYQLVGADTILCMSNGEWDQDTPVCEMIRCPAVENPQNGRANKDGLTIGSKVTFACSDGYQLVGSDTIVCQSNGEWDPDSPTCQLVECPDVNSPLNGKAQKDSLAAGSTITFTCNDGYELVGSKTIYCQPDGQWNEAAPTCKLPKCRNVRSPRNGQAIKKNGLRVGSTITFTCNDGYKLVGSSIILCQANGLWNEKPPKCRLVRCPDVENPQNGQANKDGLTIGSKVTFTCSDGYQLVGSETIVCQSNGEWDHDSPTCQFIRCPDVGAPNNGKAMESGLTPGSKVTFSCNKGYKLFGPKIITCQLTGQWNKKPPVCKPIRCPFVPPPTYGGVKNPGDVVLKPGTLITFTCAKGYQRVGPKKLICQANGKWNDEPPTCQRRCPQPVLENGEFTTNPGIYVGSIATFSCDEGYILNGMQTLTCLENGSWTDEIPTCEELDPCDSDLSTTYDDLDFELTLRPQKDAVDPKDALSGSDKMINVEPGDSITVSEMCESPTYSVTEWAIDVKGATSVGFAMFKKGRWIEETIRAEPGDGWQTFTIPKSLRKITKLKYTFYGPGDMEVKNLAVKATKETI